MAIVYTVAQQKGGAGKTTLAANLAACLATTRRVALLDVDPQHTLARWHALRMARTPAPPAIAFAEVAGWRLTAEIDRLKQSYDVLVIDSPPSVETDAKLAVRAASLVLLPVQPSPPDLWAAEGTLKLAAAEKRPIRLVFNRAVAASRLRAEVEREAAKRGVAILEASLGNRIGFASAFAMGLGVAEYAPRSVAAEEMRAVLAAVEKAVSA